jgi:hypothetical protein
MRLLVRARVYPTEDGKKVEIAIKKLFEVEVNREGAYLVGKSADRESLEKIHLLLRSQGILNSAREMFLKRIDGSQLTIRLNKQAAYAGAVNFDENSCLGSIHVTVTAGDIAELIYWLAPGTRGGKH